MEEAISEKRKTFAAAHKSDEDRQAYISTSRRALQASSSLKHEFFLLFERIISSHFHFFLESNSILFPYQANFRSGRSTLDQNLLLS